MSFLISVIVIASVAASDDLCKKARNKLETYKKQRVDSWDSNIYNPLIKLDEAEPRRNERRRLLVEAATKMLDSNEPDYGFMNYKCQRVNEAFNVLFVEDDDRWEVQIARITVLLGGATLVSEADDVLLRLGSRMGELRKKSRITTHFVNGNSWVPFVFDDLQTLEFFDSYGTTLAEEFVRGLDIFERGLIEWENMRIQARRMALKNRGFLSTGFQRFRKELFWSYPPGNVLAAICQVTAMRDIQAAGEFYGPVFGVKFADEAGLVNAIRPLVGFSQFANDDWMKELMTDKMRDLLNAIMSADLFMVNTRVIIHHTEVAGLPGLVFVRWIIGRYHSGVYSGKDRISLASRAAKIAVKLADGNMFQFPVKAELDQARQVVLTFLDGGLDDENDLKTAYSWFYKIPWARAKLGLSYAYFPGDIAYAYLLAKSYSQRS